ncbi:MAG: helix-turn-helix domain-containing protein [Actinomycetes bacterium]
MDDIADVADLLRTAREGNYLTQEELSARSGVSQSTICAIERRRRLPGLETLAQLFATMQLQMHIELEPLMSDLDARIDELARQSVQDRIDTVATYEMSPSHVLARLAGTGAVLTGALAAVTQGAPVPVERIEFDVPRVDETMSAVTAALGTMFARHDELGHARPGVLEVPEAGPETLWWTAYGEIAIRLVGPEEARTDVTVTFGLAGPPLTLPVTPLWRIEARDRTAGRVLDRMRQRLR